MGADVRRPLGRDRLRGRAESLAGLGNLHVRAGRDASVGGGLRHPADHDRPTDPAALPQADPAVLHPDSGEPDGAGHSPACQAANRRLHLRRTGGPQQPVRRTVHSIGLLHRGRSPAGGIAARVHGQDGGPRDPARALDGPCRARRRIRRCALRVTAGRRCHGRAHQRIAGRRAPDPGAGSQGRDDPAHRRDRHDAQRHHDRRSGIWRSTRSYAAPHRRIRN